jgi:hypothetical protein
LTALVVVGCAGYDPPDARDDAILKQRIEAATEGYLTMLHNNDCAHVTRAAEAQFREEETQWLRAEYAELNRRENAILNSGLPWERQQERLADISARRAAQREEQIRRRREASDRIQATVSKPCIADTTRRRSYGPEARRRAIDSAVKRLESERYAEVVRECGTTARSQYPRDKDAMLGYDRDCIRRRGERLAARFRDRYADMR